jgi:UDP-N-acetylmuramate-alanine ligase
MVAQVLNAAGLDPTAVVGGKVNVLGSNAKLGKSELMVVEADESDGSFLHLHPSIAVVTNIDPEHMDHYQTLDALKSAFVEFCNRVPFYGLNVLCLDHPNVQALLPSIEKRFVTYGSTPAADYRLEGIRLEGYKTKFRAFRRDVDLGELGLQGEVRPGDHPVADDPRHGVHRGSPRPRRDDQREQHPYMNPKAPASAITIPMMLSPAMMPELTGTT